MNRIRKAGIIVFILTCTGIMSSYSQQSKKIKDPETGKMIIVGPATLTEVADCDGFENLMVEEEFSGNAKQLETIRNNMEGLEVIAYIGTWCEDSQYYFPEIVNTLREAGYDVSKIRITGLDREKKGPDGEEKIHNVTYVPTVLFIKEGKEIGRFVEQPKKNVLQDIAGFFSK